MKRNHLALILAMLLTSPSLLSAGSLGPAQAPGDSMAVRQAVAQRPEIEELRSQYIAITRRIDELRAEDILTLLGEPINVASNDLVLPVFAPNTVYESTYTPPLGSDHSRVEAFAVGSTGVLEVHVGHNGVSIAHSVLYHRKDKDFIPLLTESALGKRLSWDKERFEGITQHLKLVDLTQLISKYLPVVNSTATNGQPSSAGSSSSNGAGFGAYGK